MTERYCRNHFVVGVDLTARCQPQIVVGEVSEFVQLLYIRGIYRIRLVTAGIHVSRSIVFARLAFGLRHTVILATFDQPRVQLTARVPALCIRIMYADGGGQREYNINYHGRGRYESTVHIIRL
jgi:hypothetical protein